MYNLPTAHGSHHIFLTLILKPLQVLLFIFVTSILSLPFKPFYVLSSNASFTLLVFKSIQINLILLMMQVFTSIKYFLQVFTLNPYFQVLPSNSKTSFKKPIVNIT